MPSRKLHSLSRRDILVGGVAVGLAVPSFGGLAHANSDNALYETMQEIIRVRRGYYKAPGISLAVTGQAVDALTLVDGIANPLTQTPVRPETRFMSGSTGKTFCAATVMRLAEEGGLSVEQKASHFFSGESWFEALPNATDITVHHLLLHQAGFPQFLDMGSFQSAYFWDSVQGRSIAYSPKKMLGFLEGTEPLFPAGAEHHYTDLGYHLLGLIIEKVADTSYYSVLRDEVLSRLSAFESDILDATTTELPNLAGGVAKGDLVGRLMGVNGVTVDSSGALRRDPSLEYTGGGLALTPRALAQFYFDLANGQIVAPDTFTEMMQAADLQPGDNTQTRYGYGMYLTTREGLGTYISHSGFFPGYTSNVGYFLDHGFSVAIQQNSDHGPDLFGMLRDVASAIISNK